MARIGRSQPINDKLNVRNQALYYFSQFVYTPDGGNLTTGGTTDPNLKTHAPLPTGGLTTGGTSSPNIRTHVPAPSGGLTTGGTGAYSKSIVAPAPSGGLTTGGTTDPNLRTHAPTITGLATINLGGTPAYSYVPGSGLYIYAPTGGIVTDGTAPHSKLLIYIPTGGLTTGGTTDPNIRTHVPVPGGGLTTGGSASPGIRTHAPAVSGGLTTGGTTAPNIRTHAPLPTGGITMGGAAGLDKVLIAIVSGLATITTGGAATLSKTKAYGVSGGLNTGGAATTAFGTSIHTYTHVSGGLVMGGTAVTAGSGAPKKTEWGGTIFVPSQVTTGRKVEKPKEQPQPKVFAYTGWATQAIVHSGSASASRTSVFTHSAIKKSNVVAFRPRGSAVIEKRFIHEYVPATHQQTTKINLSAPERKIVRFRNVEQVAKDAVRQKHEELMILLKLAR